ncbi:hypothetical protein GCM10028805_05760 [Spirosoma harenae]
MGFLKSPLIWEAGGWIAFLIVGVLCISGEFTDRLSRKQQLGFLFALLGLLFIKRLPILFINWELNPDESQLLSQAITLRHHPVYWKYIDGATMGPLSSYFVALPGYFGVPLNYIVLRWLAFGCMAVSLISGYFSIENFFSARAARLALLPAVAFLAFTTNMDFLHGTNEQLSLALIGLAIWQYSRIWRRQSFDSASQLALLSFISSLVPFAKLQGTPTVLVIVLAALISLLRRYSVMPRPIFWRALGGLIVGGILFPILVVGYTLGFGVFPDFLQFYITGNFAYGAEASFWHFLSLFPAFVYQTTDFLVFLIPTFTLIIGWIILRPRLDRNKSELLLLIVALVVISGYAIIKPGNGFTHYLLYLVAPICLLNAWFIETLRHRQFTIVWVVIVVVSIGTNAIFQTSKPPSDPYVIYQKTPFDFRFFRRSPTAQEALKLARPGDDLVVWGWAPLYNVQTQMPQGVCDNHVIRCVMGSNQAIHRARYMRNIQTSRPKVFIDAVGPNSIWLDDRATFGYETFPELKAYIDQNYHLVGEIEKNRVFARNDIH